MNISSEHVSNKYIRLNHCGVQYLWDKDYFMERPHGRSDYHILYIHQGKCYTEILGKPEIVAEGNMILFKPREKQLYSFRQADMPVSCYLHFTGTGCEQLVNRIGFSDRRVINIGKSNTLKSMFEKMETEFVLGYPFSESLCASYIQEILYFAGRRFFYTSNEAVLKHKSRIDLACQYMYEHYPQAISIEACARMCNLSVSRFAHIFRETTGKTPLEYLTEIRISRAQELLITFDYPISEVAENVGFANQNYFARIFKKYTGVSPKEYSQQNI